MDAVLRHRSEHHANSFSQRLCKLNLALNELQVALGLGKQASRRGSISHNNDLLCSPELIFPQGLPQAAMPAATTPYFQGISRKQNEILQQAAQPTKSGLGSLCALMGREELLFNTREAEGRKDKSGKAHTAFAQDTNRKAQKGAGAGGAARPLPTSYHDCSTAESGVEEVHVAFVLVYGQIPNFIQAESFLKPFRSNTKSPAVPH
jgi:hypothetical protein